MADLDFLDVRGRGNSAIIVLLPDGAVWRISGLCQWTISATCPLLGHALGDGPSDCSQATIEAQAFTSVVAFLRHLYVGSYLTPEEQEEGAPPVSLLKHIEVCKLAKDYDIPPLEREARFHFLRDTEYSMSLPNPPPHLCEAIRFIYRHMADNEGIMDTLLNYCVASFKSHSLGTNPDFLQVAFDIPDFHKGLCLTNINRNFEDEGVSVPMIELISLTNVTGQGASDIVRLPCPPVSQSDALFDCRLRGPNRIHDDRDMHVTEWYDSEYTDSEQNPEGPPMKRARQAFDTGLPLVHRPKTVAAPADSSHSEQHSDEDGFTLVYRPKASTSQQHSAASDSQTSNSESDASYDAVGDDSPTPTLVAADSEADLEIFDDFFESLPEPHNDEYFSVSRHSTSAYRLPDYNSMSSQETDTDSGSEWSVL